MFEGGSDPSPTSSTAAACWSADVPVQRPWTNQLGQGESTWAPQDIEWTHSVDGNACCSGRPRRVCDWSEKVRADRPTGALLEWKIDIAEEKDGTSGLLFSMSSWQVPYVSDAFPWSKGGITSLLVHLSKLVNECQQCEHSQTWQVWPGFSGVDPSHTSLRVDLR